MSCRQTFASGCKVAKPVLSLTAQEAHRRVMGLYRGFYRYIPTLLKLMDVPYTEKDCVKKLREYFYKNAKITDIRVIDVLVIKGYMELEEQTHHWQAKYHIMDHWKPSIDPPPCGFVQKFLAGPD